MVVGTLIGAVVGVLAARFITVLLLGLSGYADLELHLMPLSDALLLLLPPLAAASCCATALRLAGNGTAGTSALLLLVLSPLAPWLLWEVQQQFGAAELWRLRVVPVVLLTLLAPVAHLVARSLFQLRSEATHGGPVRGHH